MSQRKLDRIEDTLIMLEHPPVLTLGRAASLEALRVAESELPVQLVRTGRGGQITFHGPGQLVAYPILRLEEGRRDLHRYLRDLEAVVIDVCADFGVTAERQAGRTGVWVGERKLASIGVRASNWVTSHGVGLNYGMDLSGFDLIEPCNLTGVRMTSLGLELGQPPARRDVEARWCLRFAERFDRRLQQGPVEGDA